MIKMIIYFLSSISILASSVISPNMGQIYAFFEGTDPTLIKLILTITSLFVIPASFLSVALCKRIGKKKTLMLALLTYAIGGCLTGVFSSIYAMLASRALLGVGVGLLMPISQSLPIYFFTGTERITVITRQSASVGIGNIICTLFAGWLGLVSWRLTFLVYAISIPILIAVYFFLPAFEDENKEEAHTKKSLPFEAYFIAGAMGLFMIGIYAYYANISIFMNIREIGTSATAAYIIASGSFTSFLSSQSLKFLQSCLGKMLIPSIPIMMTIGFTLLYFAHGPFTMLLGAISCAYAMGCIMPICMIALSNVVEKSQIISAMAVMSTAMFFGQFISPVFMGILPALPGYTDYGANFLSLAILCSFATLFVLYLIFIRQKKIITH